MGDDAPSKRICFSLAMSWSKTLKCSNGKARFITIIAAPPEHFKGFKPAHCQRKAYLFAWGVVPNQSDTYAPKIGLHMQR
jgi:hypothetical protein